MWMAPRVGGRDHPASDVASKIAFNRLRRSLISRDPGIGPSSRWLRNIADIASPFELRRSPTTVRVTLGAWPRNSHSLNGPPMAAICCATGADTRPVTIRTTPKQRTRPARNAAVIRTMRLLRAVMSDASAYRERSQAGGDPCDDHLVEHRRAVVRPERHRPGKHDPGGGRDGISGPESSDVAAEAVSGIDVPTLDRPSGA